MTDKEMSVDWIRSQGWSEENLPSDEFGQMLKAYLAGLKAGKPNWHKVADGDLPKDNMPYIVKVKLNYRGAPNISYWIKDNLHDDFEKHKNYTEDIIAWCEIPKYEEEEEEEMGKRNQNMRKSRFEKEAAEYIKTHDDYRVFALDDADIMQIFKDGAEIGFQKGIKAKINTTTISDAPIKAQSAEMADGEQDKPNVFQQFLEKELPEDIQRRVERAAEYGESNAEYFFRAGFFLAHELEEAKKNQDGGKR